MSRYGGVPDGARLRVLQLNARSLRNKFNELKSIIAVHNYDIVAVTETWFNFQLRDLVGEFDIAGYKLFSKERSDKIGGGVALYIKNVIKNVSIVNINLPIEIDGICIKIRFRELNYIVSCIYRPPNSALPVDVKLYESLGTLIQSNQGVILGDFNCPNVDYIQMKGNGEGERLLNFLEDNFLKQKVKNPTRNDNILDLILTTDNSLVRNINILEPLASSDHNMVEFDFFVSGIITENKMSVPNFKKADFNKLKAEMGNINWTEELRDLSAPKMWEHFKDKLKIASAKCIPSIAKRRHPNSKPLWFNNNIENIIKERNKAYKLHKRFSNDTIMRDNYVKIRREVKKLIRTSKKNYEVGIARDSKHNPKRFFQYINNRKPLKNSIGPLTSEDGETTSDSKRMATLLNNFFSSVFTIENKEIPTAVDVITFESDNVLENIVFTRKDISAYIQKMNNNKAPGPDGIYTRHIKELKEQIVEILTKIFNKSMSDSEIPEDFKLANVTAIFKKGDKSNASNYRPISLTSLVGKLMESIIRDHIVEHLDKHNLIKNSQHGFRRNRSCLTNLLEFFHGIIENYDTHKSVDIIYLDFQKAFDTVPHIRLLEKLRAHGIRGNVLNWIAKWLRDRKQRVVVDGKESEWATVTSGVPQGSVLGPLLFLIYINDLDVNLITSISKFADDTKLGGKVLNVEDRNRIQADLDKIVEWSATWQMKFNTEKCKVLHIGSKNVKFQYRMSDNILESVSEEKDLGVIVTEDLKPDKQCTKAVSKANKMLGFISRNFEYKSQDIILPLYKSLVRPHLEYGIQFWNPYLRKDIEKLERVQRRATKLIPSLRHKTYEERISATKLTTLETRRLRGDLIQTFKIINKFDNVDADNYFDSCKDTRTRNNGFKLKSKCFNGNIAKNFFTYRVVKNWNELPTNVVNSTSVNMFKNKLDKYLCSNNFV